VKTIAQATRIGNSAEGVTRKFEPFEGGLTYDMRSLLTM